MDISREQAFPGNFSTCRQNRERENLWHNIPIRLARGRQGRIFPPRKKYVRIIGGKSVKICSVVIPSFFGPQR